MKRVAALITSIGLLLGFSGCSKYYPPDPSEEFGYNYNNISAKNCAFWLTEEGLFGIENRLFSTKYYMVSENGIKDIFVSDKPNSSKVLPYQNRLYMLDWLDGSGYWLHFYDRDTETHTGLGSVSLVQRYFAVGENLYYWQRYLDGENEVQPLWVCATGDGSKFKIAPSVLSAGVIGEMPAYIVQEDELFQIYVYDAETQTSELIGEFTSEIPELGGVDYFVNFTSEMVILFIGRDDACKMVCYDLKESQLREYPMTAWVGSFVAYEDYAFMVVTHDLEPEMEDWENTLFRVCLKDGTMEEVVQLRGIVETFVTSDDYVYVITSKNLKKLYRYDANGNRTLACSVSIFG